MNPVETVKDWFARTRQFYQDVRNEMRKVSWPTRQEVTSTTVVVLVAVVFFATYLWLVDMVIGLAVTRVLAFFSGSGG